MIALSRLLLLFAFSLLLLFVGDLGIQTFQQAEKVCVSLGQNSVNCTVSQAPQALLHVVIHHPLAMGWLTMADPQPESHFLGGILLAFAWLAVSLFCLASVIVHLRFMWFTLTGVPLFMRESSAVVDFFLTLGLLLTLAGGGLLYFYARNPV